MEILTSLKTPVNTLADLYSNFKDGGESGWFTFAGTDAKFYFWNGEKWKELIYTTITEDTNNEGQYYYAGLIDGLSGTFHLINYYNYNNALVRVLHHVQTNQVFYRGETLVSIWETPDISIASPTESDVVVINELQRYQNEQQRKTNELERIDAELNRETQEGERQTTFTENESERQSTFEENENTRQENENTRINTEQDRVSAEGARVIAENSREENTETAIQNAENATSSANAAAAAAPKTITLISITTLPSASSHSVGDKAYQLSDKKIYTISNTGDEWVDEVTPREVDRFIFNDVEYQFSNNQLIHTDNGIVSIARTSGNGAAGTDDTYTITFTNGTTTTFVVHNGSNGTNGNNGKGITSITRTSGTGAAGTTDTYTITFTDSSTTTFQVVNGANGTGATVENVRSQNPAKVPSSKLMDDELNKKAVFNVTTEVPLSAGQYYTATTARAAVPTGVKKLGLEITYATSAGVWVSEKFVGSDVANWNDFGFWSDMFVKQISLQSKNLFNKATAALGTLTNGIFAAGGTSWYASDFIPVTASTNVFAPSGCTVYQYDSAKNYIAGSSSSPSAYFTTQATCAYLRVSIFYTVLNTFQIEYGTTSSSYAAYSRIVRCSSIGNETVVVFKPDTTDSDLLALFNSYYTKTEIIALKPNTVVTQSKNLFNKATAALGTLTNGIFAAGGTSWYASDFIPVTASTNVFAPSGCTVYQYDSAKNYIAGSSSSPSAYFTTQATCAYLRVSIFYTVLNTFQIEYGTTSSSYAAYSRIVRCSSIGNETVVVFKPDTTDSDLLALFNPKLYGKNYLAIGDSVTAALNYQVKVANSLGMNLTTHALGGIGIVAMVDGATDIAALTPTDLVGIDIITFFGGLNDRGLADGVVTDLYPTQNTLAGKYNYALNKLYTLANSAGNTTLNIVAIAPYKCGKYGWIDADGDDEYPIGSGRNLLTQVQILEKVCERKGVPLINLYKNSGINEFTWNIYGGSNSATNQYTYIGEFASIELLPSGTLNQAARVVGVAYAYIHNGTQWVYGSNPYPWNADQLHLSEAGHARIASIISSNLKTII